MKIGDRVLITWKRLICDEDKFGIVISELDDRWGYLDKFRVRLDDGRKRYYSPRNLKVIQSMNRNGANVA